MATIAAILGGLLGLSGVVAGVVYWLRRDASNSVALSERNAALDVERKRIAAMEAADAADRIARAKELDAKIQAAHSASDAAALLRAETGADDPKTS